MCGRAQKGVGLLELMLSLLVIASLLFLATRYYHVSRDSLRVTQAVLMVRNVTDASYKWLQGESDFSKVSIDKLVDAGFLPERFKADALSINPWHGALQVGGANNNRHIKITLTRVSRAGCNDLAAKLRRYLAAVPSATQCKGSAGVYVYEGIF